jgi:hypothetical protein
MTGVPARGWKEASTPLAPFWMPGPLAAPDLLWWTLRVGACLCFVGHGAFGILTKEAWVPYFGVAGIGRAAAFRLMPVVGVGDILAGLLVLIRPRPAVLAYALLWTLWTALLRPLAGEPGWEFVERAGNYGVPLALLLLSAPWATLRSRLAPAVPRPLTAPIARRMRAVLALTTAALLLGHGALAVHGKPLLIAHLARVAPSVGGAWLAPIVGWAEIGLAALVVWRPTVGLCLGVAGWKLASESLFLVAGASGWEVVERTGSYAAPLALAWLLVHTVRDARLHVDRSRARGLPYDGSGLPRPGPGDGVRREPPASRQADDSSASRVRGHPSCANHRRPLRHRLRTRPQIVRC